MKPNGKLVSLLLPKTILFHDGYVGLNTDAGKAKRRWNQTLLEAQLAQDPEDI